MTTLPFNTEALRQSIEEFLQSEILKKPEEERTKRDDLLLQTGRAFQDVLTRHQKAQESHSAADVSATDSTFTSILKSYNDLRRVHAESELDIEAIALMRGKR